MKHPITLGLVCMGRDSFDVVEAAKLYARTKEQLQEIENVRWIMIDSLIKEVDEAEQAAQDTAQKPRGIPDNNFHANTSLNYGKRKKRLPNET